MGAFKKIFFATLNIENRCSYKIYILLFKIIKFIHSLYFSKRRLILLGLIRDSKSTPVTFPN